MKIFNGVIVVCGLGILLAAASKHGSLKSFTKLKRIHALQLLGEPSKSKKSSYFSYEFNLVLDDGSRIKVNDYGHLNSLRSDTKLLSEFLVKPIWDSI